MSCFASAWSHFLFLKESEMLMLGLEPEFLLGCLPSQRSVVWFVEGFGVEKPLDQMFLVSYGSSATRSVRCAVEKIFSFAVSSR